MTTLAARGSRLERATLYLSFLVLFPGFFFYHFLLGTGQIRAFLGGFFAPVSLVFVLPLVFLYVRQILRDRDQLSRTDLYYGLFLTFFAAVVAANAANGANIAIVASHILGILFMVNTFITYKMIDFALPEIYYPSVFCLLGMSAIIFGFSVDGVFRMDAMGIAKDPDSLSTYQGLARSYLFNFLCVIAYTRSMLLRALLYCIGAASLFLNTARSEFVALLFAIPIIEFYFARPKVLFVLVLTGLAALLAMNFELLLAQLPDSRILELLDLSQSTSAIARHHLNVYAMQTIAAYPVFGDYASYAPGHYAHNILSAWVDLGIFGFAYLLAILILPPISMSITGFFTKRDCGDLVHAFALACVTILLLVNSHFFTDMLISATLAMYARYNYARRHVPLREPAVRPAAPRYRDLRQSTRPARRARP